MNVYLYDDDADRGRFRPFTQSRPIGELRYGAHLLRERLERDGFPPVTGYLTAPHLADFVEAGAPPVVAALEFPAIVLRSTFVLQPGAMTAFGPNTETDGVRLTDRAGTTVGAVLGRGAAWKGPDAIPPEWPSTSLAGRILGGAWDLIADLPAALREDLASELRDVEPPVVPAGCTIIGDPGDLRIDRGATVEPLVVFDTRTGPIVVREGAEIRSSSRLAGPLSVGRHTRIVGGQLRESSIGPRCVVHGEVSNSIFVGYANKSHDGFLGHSIVGRWANLGAGTITSNLKNTYGTIRLNLGDERIETGLQFLGSLIGDHVKTAIGTMLPTGCVIGTGANLFGTRRPDAFIHPFAWGTDEPDRKVACRMFLQTAAKVLPRRDVVFDEATRRWLERVWTYCTGQPCE